MGTSYDVEEKRKSLSLGEGGEGVYIPEGKLLVKQGLLGCRGERKPAKEVGKREEI